MQPNPFPLIALLGRLTLQRFLIATAAAGGAYVIGKTVYEAGKTLEAGRRGIEEMIPILTYSVAGILVYNIARKGKPF